MYIKSLVDERKFYDISKSVTKSFEASNAVFDYIEQYESENDIDFLIDNEPMWFRTHHQINNIIDNVTRDEFDVMEDKDDYEIVYEDGDNLIVVDYADLDGQLHVNAQNNLIGNLNESLNEVYNPNYTHFAILKDNNKIISAWEYGDVDSEELNSDKEFYFKQDIRDRGFKVKDVNIYTSNYMMKKNINPDVDSNWFDYSLNEISDETFKSAFNKLNKNKIELNVDNTDRMFNLLKTYLYKFIDKSFNYKGEVCVIKEITPTIDLNGLNGVICKIYKDNYYFDNITYNFKEDEIKFGKLFLKTIPRTLAKILQNITKTLNPESKYAKGFSYFSIE